MTAQVIASPKVDDLAVRIQAEQGPEIAQMQQLTAATGVGFDRMYLQMMITHHQGAVTMSQTELTQGSSNPAARHLAQRIITAQQAEINQMQTLLRQA